MALLQARAGIARAGASRSGDFTPNVVISINGTDRTAAVLYGQGVFNPLRVVLNLNDDPDTATFGLTPSAGFTPVAKQSVVIGLGSISNRIFAGQIDRVRVRHEKGPDGTLIAFTDVECIDWSRLFDRRLIVTEYRSQSATTIAKDLIATWTSGFTSGSVEDSLPTIDYFPLTNETPSRAMTRLVALMGGGGWFIGADRDVHLFGTSGDQSAKAPSTPLTLTNTLSSLKAFSHEYDTTQIRTRVYVEGKRTQCPVQVPAGATSIPLESALPFVDSVDGLRFGTQRFTTADVNVWPLSPDTYLALGGTVGAQSTTVVSDTSAGATSMEITAFSGGLQAAGWIRIRGQYFYYGSTSTATNITLSNIPASGYGALTIDVTAGDRVEIADMVDGFAAGALTAHAANDDVVMYQQRNAASEQTALAVLEGGDGIHEIAISDGRLSKAGANLRGDGDLDAFSDADGLIRAEWDTTDMRTFPGAAQTITITGTGALSTTLTVTSVELTIPVQNYPPWKRCVAEPVRLADFDEVAVQEQT